MRLERISSATFALLVAALLVLAVGAYTSNGGFQLAGGLFLLVAIVRAFSDLRRGDGEP
jgi:uncharacterized membrane protein